MFFLGSHSNVRAIARWKRLLIGPATRQKVRPILKLELKNDVLHTYSCTYYLHTCWQKLLHFILK